MSRSCTLISIIHFSLRKGKTLEEEKDGEAFEQRKLASSYGKFNMPQFLFEGIALIHEDTSYSLVLCFSHWKLRFLTGAGGCVLLHSESSEAGTA